MSHPTLAERLKRARMDAKLTQEELAERIGFSSKHTVSHLETGVRRPSLATLEKIAAATGKTVGHFID